VAVCRRQTTELADNDDDDDEGGQAGPASSESIDGACGGGRIRPAVEAESSMAAAASALATSRGEGGLGGDVVEVEELAGAAFRAVRVAFSFGLASFAHSLGGGPLQLLGSPGSQSNSGGAKLLVSHDQKLVLKELTGCEAAFLLALLPDYIRCNTTLSLVYLPLSCIPTS
jgi:hypothetical protein